jgi:hypothetical protein
MAYINHFGHKTAHARYGAWRYDLGADFEMLRGLRRLHGLRTALDIMRQLGMAHDRKWHRPIPLGNATHQLRD